MTPTVEPELTREPEETPFEPEAEDHPDDPPAAPRLTAMDRLASHPAALPVQDRRLMLAWLTSVVLLLAVVIGMIVWRDPIMHAWPPSTRLFDLLGLGPPVP